jgi:uncharacterized oxidoreductase
LKKQPEATIMTVTSGLAYLPMAMTPTYCATKAAIHSYSITLRYQLRGTKIEVLELVPPYVQTELMGSRLANDPRAMPLKDFICGDDEDPERAAGGEGDPGGAGTAAALCGEE